MGDGLVEEKGQKWLEIAGLELPRRNLFGRKKRKVTRVCFCHCRS